MPRVCAGCGASGASEARFCRRCGAPLNITVGHDTDPPVSPAAQTVPLAEEGRATDGLLAEESQRLGEGTSRIRRTEMEDLLRRVAREHTLDQTSRTAASPEDDGAQAAGGPATASLSTPDADSKPSAASAQGARNMHARWRWAAIILLCFGLTFGLVAFISARRWKASNAAAPASEEPTQPQVATDESAQGIEPVTLENAEAQPSPSPPSTNVPTPPRARDSEAAAHPTSTEAPTATASPAPTMTTPAGQQTTTPAPSQPALSSTDHYQRGVQLWERDRRAALEEFRAAVPAVPDAYYYLGSEYYSEGRDMKTLNDGELKAALNYFLRATNGPHSGQAAKYAQLLGKEYERRKKQSRR
jgi:hypothetical protein